MTEHKLPEIAEIQKSPDFSTEDWTALMRLVAIAQQESIAEIVFKSCRIKFHPPKRELQRPDFVNRTGIR